MLEETQIYRMSSVKVVIDGDSISIAFPITWKGFCYTVSLIIEIQYAAVVLIPSLGTD